MATLLNDADRRRIEADARRIGAGLAGVDTAAFRHRPRTTTQLHLDAATALAKYLADWPVSGHPVPIKLAWTPAFIAGYGEAFR